MSGEDGSRGQLDDAVRDGVDALADRAGDPPTVVSLSDVHGYADAFASALALPGDHPAFDAVVERDADGRLHWAGGRDYVLVCNGDLVDRGGDGDRVVETVRRLQREAPPGHVRYLAGNHELFVLAGGLGGTGWYCDRLADGERREFFDAVADGRLTAAYEGYEYTYVHAGSHDGVDATRANDAFAAVADRLAPVVGSAEDEYGTFERAFDDCWVTAAGSRSPKGVDAGPLWLGWRHLPADAPPQVVGHTPQDGVTREGSVVCQDVFRQSTGRPGGEAVVVETPDGLVALERDADGAATRREL